MIGISKFIRIFADVKANCRYWQSVATKTLRIKKETLSSFRDSDKTAKTLSETPGEQKSIRSYHHIKVRTFCHAVGCLGSWRYLSSHRSKKFPCLFPYKTKYYMQPMTERILLLLLTVIITAGAQIKPKTKPKTMATNYYCEYCGHKFHDVRQLTSATCSRHPDGSHRGYHKLYEGREKSTYLCKYCGHKFNSIMLMVGGTCAHHPKGMNKGYHAPAL